MFDWLELNLNRLAQPIVIIGFIIMIIGLGLVLARRSIIQAIIKKYNKDLTLTVYICSIAIILIGVFMTIFGAK